MAASRIEPAHRLSYEDVLAMVRDGTLDEDARVELVDGVLVEMNPIGPEHRDTTRWLMEHLVLAVAGRLDVQVQDSITTPDGGLVQPDVAVVAPTPRSVLPTTARLIVEVSQTSHVRDREKVAVYAAMGVAEYWIVDLVAEVVTVHLDPVEAAYRSVTEYREGALVPRIEGVPPVPLDRLFGR